MDPGGVARSLLLTPQGKLRATLVVMRGEDEVGLLCDAGRLPVVLEDLTRYKFRVDAQIETVETTLVDLVGPSVPDILDSVGLGSDGWHRVGDVTVVSVPLGSLPRAIVAGPLDIAALGVRQVGSLAFDAVRIEVGEPVAGRDIDEKTIPQEAGIVAEAVSFTKGCYLGQELVARIDSRGRVNRSLRGVVIASNVVPPVGAELKLADKSVGVITSVAESLTVRAPIGLALVRREVESGGSVVIEWAGGSVGAEVRDLPLVGT